MSLEAFLLGFIFINQIFGIQVDGQTCGSRVPLDVDQLGDKNCTQIIYSTKVERYKLKCAIHRSNPCDKWCQFLASCLGQSGQWKRDCYIKLHKSRYISQFDINTYGVDSHSSRTKLRISRCSRVSWYRTRYRTRYRTWYRTRYITWLAWDVSFKITHCKSVSENKLRENDTVVGNEELLLRNEPMLEFLTTANEKDFRQENALQEVVEAFETTIKQFQNVSSGDSGANITSQQQPEEVLMITTVLEEFALKFASYHLNNTMRSINLTSDQVNLRAQRVFNQSERDFRLVETGKEEDNYIAIPSEDFGENGSLILAVLYKNIHDLLVRTQPNNYSSGEERRLNTILMSATIDPQNTLQQNVTLGFRSLQAGEGPRKCVFWEFSEDKSDWSEVGCTVQSMSRSQTVCSCNHLTHFAVLMQFEDDTGSNYELTQADEEILKVITYVGLTLSLIGIILTIICYVNFTDIQAPLSQTRVSLVASLGAGQIIFIAGINATENKGACVAVAALMQYFFMAAFCWMLFEGIFLYLFVVKVYNLSNKMFIYHGFSWGFPAILVSLSLSIAAGKNGIESFVSNDYCWMSSENNLKWIFIAFVVMVEVLNVLILVRVIREMTTMQEVKDKQREQLRLGIRACVVLIPLLGVTWLFGLMTSLHKAFAYIFTILNSTQGLFIFLLHCVRNTEIRARFRRKISTILPASADCTASQVDKSDIPKHDKNKKSNESLNTD